MATTKSRGRKSWPPIKAKFLEAYRDTWEEAKRVKRVAMFYDRLTAAFVVRFGYDLPLYTDPSDDADDDVLELVEGEKIPGLAGLSDEAQEARGKYFDSLRTKLTVWCNHHFRKIHDNAFQDETNALFRLMTDNNESENLRRKPYYQVYQTLYYKERVLPTFNARWATAQAEAKAQDLAPPTALSVRQRVVQECWEKETQDIKDKVHEAAEADVERRKVEMKDSMAPPTTPEEFQHRLDHCAPFVKAIAEGLRLRTGLAVSILLAGPIPANGGDIGLRSYHAGHTNDVLPRDWPAYDRGGFEKAEASMISFASRLYPLRQRQQRALANTTEPSRGNTPSTVDGRSDDSHASGSASSGSQNSDPDVDSRPSPAPSTVPRVRSPSPLPAQELDDTAAHSALPQPPAIPPDTSTPQPDVVPPAAHTESVALPLRILTEGGCPNRLVQLYQRLATAEFDIAWTECAAAFSRLQVKCGFKDPKGAHLPLPLRPAEFAVWFKYGRQAGGPHIDSHMDFLERLGAWWWSMQPPDREDNGRSRTSAITDWSSVLRPGQNGIYLVLCGLMWVGSAIFEGKEEALLPDWSTLVGDVAWVLQREDGAADVQDSALGGKRPASDVSSGRKKRRKA